MEVRVRVAPSPTGFLHVGTARAALFNWLFARKHGGKFILRIEDTDRERSKEAFDQDIRDGLTWLGIEWDELYRQSERLGVYRDYLRKLLEEKKAFWCYHTKFQLESEREAQMKNKEAPRHICEHKLNPPEEKIGGIIRLNVMGKNRAEAVVFEDLIRGTVEFKRNTLGDFSIARDLDDPLYNFANVVDDHEMNINHIIRGEDHIPNTPKQILIAEALGFSIPFFAHLPLILGEDRSKLSKRHGATALSDYRQAGYLPEALINFIALLGWSPGGNKEIMTRSEMVSAFSLEGIQKGGAIFDLKKLRWMNSEYIKKMPPQGLIESLKPTAKDLFNDGGEILSKIIHLVQERIEAFSDLGEFHYFFREPEITPDLLIWKKSDAQGARKALTYIEAVLEDADNFEDEKLRNRLDAIAEKEFEGDRGAVYWPFRVALSGQKFSPDPVEMAVIFGNKKTRERVQRALTQLG
ncbi:MAG: glutamate--tRNA ligase [Candidatus Yanofskybacteria bacterium CG10_big_fil_rev_8_21_14_0_10_46_23]|uniref:Glutamate--tRNA ligase n=1 Tax=Candidatus Yanofskybacteria bacterium CG10_big_fil_rev_8_21_14_0_10_46_23 TaxID=1975098 RepID=A0A2H0R4V4_9BACT|nr:MAG: glutamate--tRNA ligase [Candidatus Yanofskybacteria bacterium CG10_big_fil_rev_8_21_14_0_10_46_23]